jgi:hypothetical protein
MPLFVSFNTYKKGIKTLYFQLRCFSRFLIKNELFRYPALPWDNVSSHLQFSSHDIQAAGKGGVNED